MTNKINLKELEKKAFRSTFQDGLWDIFWGFLLLQMSVFPWIVDIYMSVSGIIVVSFVVVIIALIILLAGKRFITIPRMGFIKFSSTRKAKLKKIKIILYISVVGTTLLLITTKYSGFITGLPMSIVIFSVQTIIVFFLGAYFLNIGRLYLYGVLFALPFPLGFIMKKNTFHTTEILLICPIPAVLILILGTVLLIRFVNKYPKQLEEV